MSVLEPAPAKSRSQSKVPITKGVEPRLGLLDGVDDEVCGASDLSRIEARIKHPVMALDSSLVKMHVIQEVDLLFSHVQTEGNVHIGGPSSSMHGPATSALLVQENEVFHRGGWDYLDSIISISKLEIDDMVPIPEQLHLYVYIFTMSGQHRVVGIHIHLSLLLF